MKVIIFALCVAFSSTAVAYEYPWEVVTEDEAFDMKMACNGISPDDQSIDGANCFIELAVFVRKGQEHQNPKYLLYAARYFYKQRNFQVAYDLYRFVLVDFAQPQFSEKQAEAKKKMEEIKQLVFIKRVAGKTRRLIQRANEWLDE